MKWDFFKNCLPGIMHLEELNTLQEAENILISWISTELNFFSQCIRVSSLLESFQLIFQSTATAFVYWLFNYCSKARHPLLWIAGYTSPDFDASKSNGKSITQKIIVNSINIGIVTFFIFQTPWSLIVIFGFSLEFSCFCIFCTFWMFYVNSSCLKKEYTLSIT